MGKRLLVRMYFANGAKEVRPADWVTFTTPEDFMMDEPQLREKIDAGVETHGEIYIANLNNLNGIQLYKGEFTDANKNKQHKPHNRGSKRS